MGNPVEQGTIETRSGTWEWHLKTFNSWPKSSPVRRHLGFRDPSNAVNTMSVRVEPEVTFTESSVLRLSLGPRSRRFADRSGNVWVAHPAGERATRTGGSIRQISVHSLEHLSKSIDLPPGRTLGDMKNGELLSLVQPPPD